MRITHISSADNKGGGARSAYRLHNELRIQGIDSQMFVKNKFTDDEYVKEFVPGLSFYNRMHFRFRRRIETGGLGYFTAKDTIYNGFSPPTAPPGIAPLNQLRETDILNLHWISGFWDLRILPHLVGHCRAIVWRLSDMNPFTGGCFYDNQCGRYRENCGCCPCLDSKKINDLSRKSLNHKKRIFESLPSEFLHIVAQSRWIEGKIKESNLFENLPVSRIHNGIDIAQFKPAKTSVSRSILGLPEDHAIIIFVSQNLSNPRKGYKYFVDSMKGVAEVSELPITILAIGNDSFPDIEGINIIQKENLDNDDKLAQYYSSANVFVITSLQDNLPNTVLESMACGTPVVGFDTGGVSDMVVDGVTGYLVPAKDTRELAKRIHELTSDEKIQDVFSRNSRQHIVNNFSLKSQVRSYIDLYERITS